MIHALFEAAEPLSQRDLADRVGVSTQSIRNDRGHLDALGLVTIDVQGWRLALSFRTAAERRNAVVPEFVTAEFLDALLTAVLPSARYGDPDDPVGEVLFWLPDPRVLVDHSDLGPWVRLAAQVTGTEWPENETTISVGPAIEQTVISEPTEATV